MDRNHEQPDAAGHQPVVRTPQPSREVRMAARERRVRDSPRPRRLPLERSDAVRNLGGAFARVSPREGSVSVTGVTGGR